MKRFKFFKFLCVFFIVTAVVCIGLLFAYCYRPKGTHKTNPWSSTDIFNMDSTVQLEKQANKDFVILNLADLQLTDMSDLTIRPIIHKEITELIERTNPDLITLTGDQVWCGQTKFSMRAIIRWLDGYKIPWAPVFGNHDDEGNCSVDYMCDLYENAKYCVFNRGPSNLGCLGNYVINIMENGKVFKSIYMMNLADYDEFTDEQLAWFKWNAEGIKTYNNGIQPEAMCFFHKPISQYRYAYNFWRYNDYDPSIGFGDRYEYIGWEEYKFFDIAKSYNVKNMVCGHNHGSNFSITYEGVTLTYALKTGELCYFYGDEEEYRNGGTTLTLKQNETVVKHNYVEENKYHIKNSDKRNWDN